MKQKTKRRAQQIQLDFAVSNSSKYRKHKNSKNGFGYENSSFGGSLLKNSHAKCERILKPNKPIHLVLRSSQATGKKSFLYRGRWIDRVIKRHARKWGVRVYELANGGNHLHFVLRLPKQRQFYNAFIRGLTSEIARAMTGAKRGQAALKSASRVAKLKKIKPFWDQRPFTRVLSGWGREYQQLKDYLRMNNCETYLNMSRAGARQMLQEIRQAMREGALKAVGFT